MYWDTEEKRVGAYRTTTPEEFADADDLHPYEVEGEHGIAHLVTEYGKRANQDTQVSWPTSEREMRDLQMADQILVLIQFGGSFGYFSLIFWIVRVE